MKVNELRFECRVGNLVFRDNHLAKIIAVSEIGIASEIIQRASQSTNSDTHSRIPLTEEWLVKGGFYNPEQEFFDIEIDHNRSLSINLVLKRACVGSGVDWTIIKFPEHLHTLQNLYFALTGEELTLQEEVKP
jgi:hypothetical protein